VLAALDEGEPGRADHVRALQADLTARDVRPDGPSRRLLSRLGERWTVFLLCLLHTGRYRHSEIRRIINALAPLFGETLISARVLIERLRDLERDGLVERHVSDGNLPAVYYTLTPLGHDLMVPVRALLDWNAAHRDALSEAARRFDAVAAACTTSPWVHRIGR
jgi:DNA-binding HxlR family transcriptional regulator